jgi:hypothetical protein
MNADTRGVFTLDEILEVFKRALEVETRMGTVWTIQDGRVIRTVWFPSRADTLEAVGLSE